MHPKRGTFRLPPIQRDAPLERTRPSAPRPQVYGCFFCGTPHAAADARNPVAHCVRCASPLFPAARHAADDSSRRAFARASLRMPVTFTVLWNRPMTFTGTTDDVSINGMRFQSAVRLILDERVKVECDFCSAVGDVRHVAEVRERTPPHWTIGIEFLTLCLKTTRGQFVDLKT